MSLSVCARSCVPLPPSSHPSRIHSLQDGNTPLSLAAYNGHAYILAMLLEKGADKEAKSSVSQHQQRRPCTFMATKGPGLTPLCPPPDPLLALQNGHTPLIWAAEKGHAEIATLLLGKGAVKEARDSVSHSAG